MKKSRLTLALAGILAVAAAHAVDLKSDADKSSYAIGVDMGRSVKDINDDGAEINVELLINGLKDAATGADLSMSDEEMQDALQQFSQERMLAMKKKADEEMARIKAEGEKLLKENQKKKGVKVTDSGLQYLIMTEGEGISPGPYDEVEVKYTGKLPDGEVFDSSESHGGSVSFKLNQVIDGWREGLQLMKQGGKAEFVIPSDLAYGDRGAGNSIPPNAVLNFEVELLKVTPNPDAEKEKAEEEKQKAELEKAQAEMEKAAAEAAKATEEAEAEKAQ